MLLEELLPERVQNSKTNYNQAVKQVKTIAPLMKQAGLAVDGKSIAPLLNTDADYAQQILKWGVNKGKLDASLLGAPNGNDPIKRMVVDAFIAKNQGGGLGVERVSQRTGLSPEQITDIVQNKWDQLSSTAQQYGINLKPAFYGNIQQKHTGYDKTKESLADAIHRVMKDLTNNFSPEKAQSVAAHEIADELGVARTTVDRELSNNPKLRKLEPFRKLGKRAGMTDDDRAARYHRMQRQGR